MPGPFELLERVVAVIEDLGQRYAVGGSLASSLLGEPRSTNDVDLAVRVEPTAGEELVDRLAEDLYVPLEAARAALVLRSTFNVLDLSTTDKVDVFVVGDGLLDRRQIERAVPLHLPGSAREVWVTAPEDIVLRKLDWFARSGHASERQWRDVVGVLEVSGATLDLADLRRTAVELGSAALLTAALAEAGVDDG